VAHVGGTDLFKIGIAVNLRKRKNAVWTDAPRYIKERICLAHGIPYVPEVGECWGDRHDEGWINWRKLRPLWKLRPLYRYVIVEEYPERAQALAAEQRYRGGLAHRKLCARGGQTGDWFSF
jgi:hypothetical protein